MPTGILAESGGADVGVTTAALTYDDVVKLFFSVKSRYRRNAVWIMNDETAYALRTLKDANGNYTRQTDILQAFSEETKEVGVFLEAT